MSKIKKIIIAPDSFKGTLSSVQVCEIIAQVVGVHFPGCETVKIPIADGGEGTVDSFLACMTGEKVTIAVKNPFMEDMQAFYGLFGDTAVVEMAVCAGLPLAGDRKNPLIATTFGVGQLILDAAARGVKRIIVGLGGSATNDGGCGAAAACGVSFFDRDGNAFVPTGGALADIERIDVSGLDERLNGIDIAVMCDITNPMFGSSGAAYVFAPQKGASPGDVVLLDDGLRNLHRIICRDIGVNVAELPGAGAAGAMGAGMVAFLRSRLQSGIETVLDVTDFDRCLEGANFVFTGEGFFDSQSLGGKAVIGVAKRAKAAGVPTIVVAGGAEEIPEAYEMGICSVFSINRLPQDFSVSRYRSADNLREAADNICRLIKVSF